MKMITSWVFIIAFLFYMTTAAYAVPVGIFSWGESIFGEPAFMIENVSPLPDSDYPPNPCTDALPCISFFDVFVDLTVDDGSTFSMSILDELAETILEPGEIGQTWDSPVNPNILLATLRFEFMSVIPDVTVPGTMRLVDADGNPINSLELPGSFATIDYYVPSGGQVPVPEPGTLILSGMGLVMLTVLGRMRNTYSKVMKRR